MLGKLFGNQQCTSPAKETDQGRKISTLETRGNFYKPHRRNFVEINFFLAVDRKQNKLEPQVLVFREYARDSQQFGL